jgi:hypothetical protein
MHGQIMSMVRRYRGRADLVVGRIKVGHNRCLIRDIAYAYRNLGPRVDQAIYDVNAHRIYDEHSKCICIPRRYVYSLMPVLL